MERYWHARQEYRKKELEMEFKVGDRVKIKSWEEMEDEYGLDELGDIKCLYNFSIKMKHLIGRTARIEEINDKKIKLTDWNDTSGDLNWFFSLDMVKPVTFAKKDLQVGDKVTDRESFVSYYVNGDLCGETNYTAHLTNDLKDINGNAKNDIVKVERPTYATIFERGEEPVEMTVEEIEERLGMVKGSLRVKQ